MRRRAKPAKAKVKATVPVARKSPKNEASGRSGRRELEKRLAEALEQQTATSEILRVISSSRTDVQPVFDAIADSAVRLCDGVFSAVFRFDGTLLHFVAHHSFSPEGLEEFRHRFPMPPNRGHATGRAVLERAVVHVHDVTSDPELPVSRHLSQAMRFRSVVCVPMLREGDPIGAITVARAEAGPFSERQIELLKTFADQAVIAIENVRLFKELEARNRDLTGALDRETATAGILRSISQAQADVQPVFEAIAESAIRLFEAWSAGVFRYEDGLIRLAAARGGLPGSSEALVEQRQTPQRPTDDAPRDRAVLSRTVQHVVDVESDPSCGPRFREDARLRGFRSSVAVPMLRGEDVLGVIALSRSRVGGFAPAEIALLQTFADQAVIAIENARLLKELQTKNAGLTEALEQQTATAEILRVISRSPTDVQPVFDTIAERAMRLCDAELSLVQRSDGEHLHLAAIYGANPAGVEVARNSFPMPLSIESCAGRAVRTRGVVHLADVLDDPTYALKEQAGAMRFRSGLAVPMLRDDHVIGAVFVGRSKRGLFSDTQIALLQTFADQAVIAIENARLLTELQARTGELTRSVEKLTALGEAGFVEAGVRSQPIFPSRSPRNSSWSSI